MSDAQIKHSCIKKGGAETLHYIFTSRTEIIDAKRILKIHLRDHKRIWTTVFFTWIWMMLVYLVN